MKNQITCLTLAFAVAAASAFTACKNLPPDTGRRILDIALRLAAYQVVKNNPDLGPVLQTVAGTVRNFESFALPESVGATMKATIRKEVSDPVQAAAAEEIAEMLVDYYSTIYAENAARLSGSDYVKILKRLAEAIEMGAVLAPSTGRAEIVPAGTLDLRFL